MLSVAGYARNSYGNSRSRAGRCRRMSGSSRRGRFSAPCAGLAAGEPVAVLLDQTQAAALPSLPFATDLKVVTQSAELPVALLALIDARLSSARAQALKAGLLKMGQSSGSAGVLAPLHLRGFVQPQLPSHPAPP